MEGGTSGQHKVDEIINDWQHCGQHMAAVAREMTKRDEKYFTGSAIQRANNTPWVEETVRRHGRIFIGS